jgi:hypothetical protein
MDTPALISDVYALLKSEDITIPSEKVKDYICKYERTLSHEELKQIAIIISYYWFSHKNDTGSKKRATPYKIQLLYKNLGSKVYLDELPTELLLLVYTYIKYIFE